MCRGVIRNTRGGGVGDGLAHEWENAVVILALTFRLYSVLEYARQICGRTLVMKITRLVC